MNGYVPRRGIRSGATRRIVVACTIAVLIVCRTASAQTSGSQLPDQVKEGQKVVVTDEQGRQLRGRILTLTTDSLTLARGRDREQVPYAQIVTVDTADDVRNGALIGMAVGLGLLALEASAAGQDGITLNPAGYLVFGVLYGGLGAGAGAGIDALIGGNRNIYRRGQARVSLAPRIGRDRVGASFGISW